MAGKIPRDFIQELLARVDLVDLIDIRVPLKASGSNHTARCPFHNDKSPSFSVSRTKQFYHCFGCGAHGNAIGFLMEYERLSFVEAVESLADSVGMKIPYEQGRTPTPRQDDTTAPLYEVQDLASRFYHAQFRANPAAARAVDYLKQRGVTGEIAQRYRLGYAPPGWTNLPADYPRVAMEASGLLIVKDGKRYDRFRDRVMFPIRDRRGRVIGFGARTMGDDIPKYLNSPETAAFKKGKEVYGLYELLNTLPKPERIIVVEGYMDVIALAQHGIPNAVATLGTATSADHVALLFRYTPELVFCFDGDNAGRKAAWKALESSLPALRDGRRVGFLALPEGHDPDSLVRAEGTENFLARVENARPFSKYFLEQLTRNLGFATIATEEQRSALENSARPLLDQLPAGVFRDMMARQLQELTGYASVETGEKSAKLVAPVARPSTERRTRRWEITTLRLILARLIQEPSLFPLIDADTRARLEQNPKAGPLCQKLFALLDDKPGISVGGIVEWFRDEPEYPQIDALSHIAADGTPTEFGDALQRFAKQALEERLEALIQKQAQGGLNQEELAEMSHLFREKARR